MSLASAIPDETRPRADAATWVLVYVVVLYAIPSRLVIPALGSAGAPSLAIGLVSFLAWALYQIGKPRSDAELFQPRPVRRALVVFLLCVCLSYAVGMARPIDGDEVSPADVALLAVLSWSGTLLIANDGIPSLPRLHTLAHRLAWAGGLMGLLGIAQFLTGDILINRISIPGLRAAQFEVFTRSGFIRPSGTATHPIEFGIILAMMMPFALHSAYLEGNRRITRWLPSLLLGVSIALTFSRSAYISTVVALLILVIGWPWKRRFWFAGGLLALCVVLFAAVPRLFGTIGSLFRNVDTDPSISSRTESYDLAFKFFFQSPFFGRGLGTFLPKYRIFDNQYLLLLVSIGAVGALAMILLFASGLRSAFAVTRSAHEPDARDLALSVGASVAAGVVSLATFDAFAFPMTMGTLFLVLGIAGALYRLAGPVPVVPRPLFRRGRTQAAEQRKPRPVPLPVGV